MKYVITLALGLVLITFTYQVSASPRSHADMKPGLTATNCAAPPRSRTPPGNSGECTRGGRERFRGGDDGSRCRRCEPGCHASHTAAARGRRGESLRVRPSPACDDARLAVTGQQVVIADRNHDYRVTVAAIDRAGELVPRRRKSGAGPRRKCGRFRRMSISQNASAARCRVQGHCSLGRPSSGIMGIATNPSPPREAQVNLHPGAKPTSQSRSVAPGHPPAGAGRELMMDMELPSTDRSSCPTLGALRGMECPMDAYFEVSVPSSSRLRES